MVVLEGPGLPGTGDIRLLILPLMLLGIIKHILLHNAGSIPIGGKRRLPLIFPVNNLLNPGIHRSQSCPSVGEKRNAIGYLIPTPRTDFKAWNSSVSS